MVMQRAIGFNPECDSTLGKIFGTDLEAGVEQLSDFLLDLGISTSPEDYGMEKKEWSALVQTAIGSGLGKNFVGRDVTPAT
jgi:alcohol dehydrogenase class IV